MQNIAKQLKDLNLDAYLIYDFRGSNFIGREVLGFKTHTTRRWVAIVDHETVHWILPKIESKQFEDLAGEKHPVATYDEFHTKIRELLAKYKRVAIDYSPNNDLPLLDILPVGVKELLSELAPEAEFVTSAELTQCLAAQWGENSYKTHKVAVQKLNEVFNSVFAYIRTRLDKEERFTDYDVMRYALELYEQKGIFTDDGICIIATNENSSNPHYWPKEDSQNYITENSVLLVDMWAKLKEDESMYADFTKMAWIGPSPVPKKFQSDWGNYVEALESGVKFISENIQRGIHGFEVDKIVREKLVASGYEEYLVHRTGHSLGKYEHGNGANLDDFETHDTRKLLPDTGITLEPGIYMPEHAIRTEINIYIRPDMRIELTVPVQTEIVIV